MRCILTVYRKFNTYMPLEVSLQPTAMENRLILKRSNQNVGDKDKSLFDELSSNIVGSDKFSFEIFVMFLKPLKHSME